MKVKILVGLLVFLIVVNLVTLGSYIYFRWKENRIYAHWRTMRHREHAMAGKFPREPFLTPDQRKKLGKVLRETEQQLHPFYRKNFQLQKKLYHQLLNPQPNMDSINAYLAQIESLQTQIHHKRIEKLLETKSFLDSTQQRILFWRLMKGGGRGVPPPHMLHHQPGKSYYHFQ